MLDGDLSAGEQRAVEAHIQSCPSCALLYRAFSHLSEQIALNLEEPPPELFDSIMDGVRQEAPHRRVPVSARTRSMLAAVACLALVLGLSLGLPPMLRSLNEGAASVQDALTEAQTEWIGTAATMPADGSSIHPGAIFPGWGRDAAQMENAGADAPPVEVREPARNPGGPETRDYSDWLDPELLRVLLGAEPCGEEPKELPDPLAVLTLQREGVLCDVPVYQIGEQIIFLDPETESLWVSNLSPAEFDDFLNP